MTRALGSAKRNQNANSVEIFTFTNLAGDAFIQEIKSKCAGPSFVRLFEFDNFFLGSPTLPGVGPENISIKIDK